MNNARVKFTRRHALSALSAALMTPALAKVATPVSASIGGDILIGQSAPLSGPAASTFVYLLKGQELAVTEVNAKGGINGRLVKVITLDDGYDTKRCTDNVVKLIDEEKVVALYGLGSTAGVAATLPILSEKKVPLIGVYTGSPSLRAKQHPYFFTLMASYRDEVVQMMRNQITLQRSRVALLYLNNPFGQLMVPVVDEVAKEMGITIVSQASLEMSGADAVSAAQTLAKGNPQAVIMLAFGPAIGPFIKASRAYVNAPIYSLGIANGKRVLDTLGDEVRGLAYTEPRLYPWNAVKPITRDYNNVMNAAGIPIDYDHMFGYQNMRSLLAILARAGRSITPQSLVTTIERMNKVDIGGYVLDFSPTNHHGSKFVETVVVGPGGRYLR